MRAGAIARRVAPCRVGSPASCIRRAFVRETVPDVMRHVVQGLSQPAYVTGQRWDVLVWNGAAAGLLTDFGRVAEEDRNILFFMLTDPNARDLFGVGWAEEARRMVSLFRATHTCGRAIPPSRSSSTACGAAAQSSRHGGPTTRSRRRPPARRRFNG